MQEGQPDVGADVDDEADHVRRSASSLVCQIPNEGGGQALKDEIGGDGQIDLGQGLMEVVGQGGESWIIDVGRQGREQGCEGGDDDDEIPLSATEDGIGRLLIQCLFLISYSLNLHLLFLVLGWVV